MINKLGIRKFWLILLLALGAFPILPRGIETALLIMWALVSGVPIFLSKRKLFRPRLEQLFRVVLLSVVPLIYLLSLIYSQNLVVGLDQFIRVTPLLIIPVVLSFNGEFKLSETELRILKGVFLLSTIIGLLYLQITLWDFLYSGDHSRWKIRQEIEFNSDVHGTYLSIWIGFAIFLLAPLFWDKTKNGFPVGIFVVLPALFLLYWQYIIGAKAPMMATILLFVGYTFYRLYFSNKRVLYAIVTLFIAFWTMFTISKPKQVEQWSSLLKFDHKLPKGDYAIECENISSQDIRFGIYTCCWKLFRKSPMIGYGVGDVQDELNLCYLENIDGNVYQKFNFNTHNEYLQVLLTGGMAALFLFLLSLAWPIYISIRKGCFLLFALNGFIMICFLTENVIGRHDGVIFYGLFNSILTFNCLGTYEKGTRP
jgi:hypothetical protein